MNCSRVFAVILFILLNLSALGQVPTLPPPPSPPPPPGTPIDEGLIVLLVLGISLGVYKILKQAKTTV